MSCPNTTFGSGFCGAVTILNETGDCTPGSPVSLTTYGYWQLSSNMALMQHRAFNTRGYPFIIAGLKGWQGSFNFYGKSTPFKDGDPIYFRGYADNGIQYALRARVVSVNFEYDYQQFDARPIEVQWVSDYRQSGDELVISEGVNRPTDGAVQYTVPKRDGVYTICSFSNLCVASTTLSFQCQPIPLYGKCFSGYQAFTSGPRSMQYAAQFVGNNFKDTPCEGSQSDLMFDLITQDCTLIQCEGNCQPETTTGSSCTVSWNISKIRIGGKSGLVVSAEGNVIGYQIQGMFDAMATGATIKDPNNQEWYTPLCNSTMATS